MSWFHKTIRNEFVHNFVSNFKTSDLPLCVSLSTLFPFVILDGQNDLLVIIPSLIEIKAALWDMHSLKAPTLNGLKPLFYIIY